MRVHEMTRKGATEARRLFVVFEPAGRRITVQLGTTVLEAAMGAGVTIASDCGGQGTCGRCKVVAHELEALGEPTSVEAGLLSRKEAEAGYRLACQATVERDVVVMIPEESRGGERKFQAVGLEGEVAVDPSVRKITLILPRPTLEAGRTIAEEIVDALEEAGMEEAEFDLWALRLLPEAPRTPSFDVTVTLWRGRRIISVEEGDTSGRLYGAALDMGTSKVVGHLVDLRDGRTLAVASTENPQVVHGEDVMSRITFALKSPGNTDELRRLLLEAVNKVLKALYDEADVQPHEVYEAVVVGNTVMHHLFLGIEPSSLARSPFMPLVRRALSIAAGELGVSIYPAGVVYLPPLIAGFVGSDAVSDLMATEVHISEEPALLIDIGTNTEVIVGDRMGLEACSCASGPAFEGAHISHGMKAVSGAIERLRIDPETLDVGYETIGGGKPIGLCGSAMVDALAEMWKNGLVNEFGRLNLDAGTPRMRASADGGEFVVAWGDAAGTGRDITLTQGDIRELMLAKAAIYAASYIMLRRRGIEADEITRAYVAGAFGSYIDPVNAVVIGMLPDMPPEKITFVGNTAVTGAKKVLLSKAARSTAEAVLERIHYHELSIDPEFNREFLKAVFIPHREPGRFPTAQRLARSRRGP